MFAILLSAFVLIGIAVVLFATTAEKGAPPYLSQIAGGLVAAQALFAITAGAMFWRGSVNFFRACKQGAK